MWSNQRLVELAQTFVRTHGTGRDSPCWIWPGWESPYRRARYAQVMLDGKNRRAHRAMYEALIGPVPRHLVLDHLCLTKACCNPDHLEPVTVAVNNRRAIAAGLCPRDRPRRKRFR